MPTWRRFVDIIMRHYVLYFIESVRNIYLTALGRSLIVKCVEKNMFTN